MPLDVLLDAAIKHAREGYVVTRSQARLTAEKLPEMDKAVGFTRSLPDRRQSAGGRRQAQADRIRRHARSARASRLRRFLSRRCRPRDRRRSGTHRRPGDARRSGKIRGQVAEPLSVADSAGTLYNTPPPTQGLASLMILALFDRLRVRRPKASSTSTAWSKRPSAPSACATVSSPIRPGSRSISTQFLVAEIPRRRGGRRSTARKAALAAALRRRRHHLDGRGGCLRPRRLLHPVALLGIRLRLRAAGDRHPDAEPRRELLARSRRRSTRSRPAAARSTRSTRRSPRSRTAASWPTAPWAATASRRRRPRCSRATSRSASRSTGARRAALAARPHLGLDPHQPAAGIALRRQSDRPADVGRPRRRGASDAYSDTMGHAGAVVLHPDGTLEGGHDPRADGGAAGV